MTRGRRIKVLFDVDGVICDWFPAFLKTANALLGTSYTLEDVPQYDVFAWLDERHPVNGMSDRDTTSQRLWKAILVKGYYENLPITSGAQETIDAMRSYADIVFVTATAFTDERTKWLKKHFHAHSDDIIVTSGKHHISGDILFEDSIDNITRWVHHQIGSAYLVDAPYNRHDTICPRVKTFPEMISVVAHHFKK